MQQIIFNVPVKTYMGPDVIGRLGEEAEKNGGRAVIVTGTAVADTGIPRRIENILSDRGISSIIYDHIGPETTSEAVDAIVNIAESGRAQMVIGIGGVKTLSIARTAALLTPSRLRVDDFIDGHRPSTPALPVLNVITACRDPFMFKGAVMLTDQRNRHCHIRDTLNSYPEAVFIDPASASNIPDATFSFTIMDTLMYAIEGYLSERSNFLSESLFLKAISAVVSSDKKLDDETDRSEAFQKAARAGLVTAMGLSMAGPGLGAAVSMIIASRFRVPRVLASAIILPMSLEYGLKVIPEKIARLAPILNESASGDDVIETAERVVEIIRHRIGLKRVQMRFSEFGIGIDDLGTIAEAVRKFDFITQMPSPLSTEDLIKILRRVL